MSSMKLLTLVLIPWPISTPPITIDTVPSAINTETSIVAFAPSHCNAYLNGTSDIPLFLQRLA